MIGLKHKVLVIDDDDDILEFIEYNLINEGYEVKTSNDSKKGIELITKFKPQIVILDIMIPEIDGIEICQIIRENREIKQPIVIFLTARTEDYTQIAGFEAGADDYITKPIRPRLLLKKLEALKRREYKNNNSLSPKLNSIDINRDRYTIKLDNGSEILLPKKEFELLEFLANSPGSVYNRDVIMDEVWGEETIVGPRTIDVHIRKLREKIGEHYIRTIKGVGYTFEDL